ncbi:MAG TPA: hypothetical protein VLI72_18410 [Methylibium sp.]|nr:hypothetical protein [Methylibium sp.]
MLQDVGSYERTQQTLALLKLVALGREDIEAGHITPAEAAFDRLLVRKAIPASGA